jgi:hypothetical protein
MAGLKGLHYTISDLPCHAALLHWSHVTARSRRPTRLDGVPWRRTGGHATRGPVSSLSRSVAPPADARFGGTGEGNISRADALFSVLPAAARQEPCAPRREDPSYGVCSSVPVTVAFRARRQSTASAIESRAAAGAGPHGVQCQRPGSPASPRADGGAPRLAGRCWNQSIRHLARFRACHRGGNPRGRAATARVLAALRHRAIRPGAEGPGWPRTARSLSPEP